MQVWKPISKGAKKGGEETKSNGVRLEATQVKEVTKVEEKETSSSVMQASVQKVSYSFSEHELHSANQVSDLFVWFIPSIVGVGNNGYG